jgi:hypothetical protein
MLLDLLDRSVGCIMDREVIADLLPAVAAKSKTPII